jgi:hypothetical protein
MSIVNATIFFSRTQKFLLNVMIAWHHNDYSIILASYICLILSQADDFMKLVACCVGWNNPALRYDYWYRLTGAVPTVHKWHELMWGRSWLVDKRRIKGGDDSIWQGTSSAFFRVINEKWKKKINSSETITQGTSRIRIICVTAHPNLLGDTQHLTYSLYCSGFELMTCNRGCRWFVF